MRNAILITFMSFLCLSITYGEHDRQGETRRSSNEDRRYETRPEYTFERNLSYFTYEGGDDFQTLTLSDLEEVWVNETRQVRSTCTREVPVRREVCRNVMPSHDNSERPHHGGSHGRPPRRECRVETTYRTENYVCFITETVRTRRPDKRYHANVSIEFKNMSRNRYRDGRSEFLARLDKSLFTLNLQEQNSREENLFFMKEELRTSQFGDVTEVSGLLRVFVFDKEEFLKPLRHQIDVRPEVHQGELVLKMGKVSFEKDLRINLTLNSDYGRTLHSGTVRGEFVTVRDGRFDDESIVIINLDRLLHGGLRRGDFLNVQLTVSFIDENLRLLNSRSLPPMRQSTRASVSVR